MDERYAFPAVTAQFSLACCLATVTYLITLSSDTPGSYYPLVLLAYSPLSYALNRLFLCRERTLLVLSMANGILWLTLFASICWLEGMVSWERLAFAGAFSLWVTAQGAQLALKGASLRSLILHLDVCALLLVLLTAYLAAMGLSYLWAAPAAAGFASSVLGMTANRMGRPMGGREWVLVGGAFLLISLIVLVLVGVAAAPAGHGLVALWTALVAAVKFLLGQLWRLLLFLSSLFPDPEPGELEMEPGISIPLMEEEGGESNPVILAVMLILVAGLILFLLVWALRLLGRLRVGGLGGTAGKRTGTGRTRPSLWAALRRLAASWARRVRLRRFLWQHRDQPVGLYYVLVGRCRMGPWHKRPGETPREFLTRLQDSARGDPELEEALSGLIPRVDRALYAPEPERRPVPQATLIRRRIGRAVGRQFLRDCAARGKETVRRLRGNKTARVGS